MSVPTQNFQTVKTNLTPAYQAKPVAIGIRVDDIRYFDKQATTDTVEPLTDATLRPIPTRNAARQVVDTLRDPSR